MDLIDSIDRWSERQPERLAHVSGESTLTYRELTQRSNLLAARLMETLADDDSPVAVVGHKEPEMLVAFLGAEKAGHPYVPIDSGLPARRIQAILETAKTGSVLTPEKIGEMITETVVDLSGFVPHRRPAESPWYIIFTSGSTGDPKGVVITQGCLESFVAWAVTEQNFVKGQEIFLNQAPFSFDLSVMDLYSSLVSGGTLFSLDRETIAEPKLLYKALTRSGITIWVSTPSFAQLCLAEPGFSGSSVPGVKKFWFCGETLAPDVAAELIRRFPGAEVWNTYGPTEATVATTSIRIDTDILSSYNPLPVGRPKPDSRIQIIDNGIQVAGEGRGEIVIAGKNVSPGYLHRPDLSARSFFQLDGMRAYRSGDLGHFRDGLLFFDGRIDLQIKLHGYRIELGDIEANLCALVNVQDAVVIPALKNGSVEYLAAFVILRSRPAGSDFDISLGLKRGLAERLPEYIVPRKFVFLPQFPMTVNGKADRRELAESLS